MPMEPPLASAVLSRPAPPPDLVLSYGPGPEHVADVRLPPVAFGVPSAGAPPGDARPAPLVVFLHGGFWRGAFDRTHTGPLAAALPAAGVPVCQPEVLPHRHAAGRRARALPG